MRPPTFGHHSYALQVRDETAQQLKPLARKIGRLVRHAGDVAAGPGKRSNQTEANRITRGTEDDRYDRRRLLGRSSRRGSPCDDDGDF